MTSSHLSDEDLQACALGNVQASDRVMLHLQSCAHCRENVQLYRTMFSGIKAEPVADFDIDLSQRVLSEIKPVRKFSWINFFVGFFIVSGILLISLAFYRIRVIVFSLLHNSTSYVLYLCLITVLAIAVFQFSEAYREYRKKMNALKYY